MPCSSGLLCKPPPPSPLPWPTEESERLLCVATTAECRLRLMTRSPVAKATAAKLPRTAPTTAPVPTVPAAAEAPIDAAAVLGEGLDGAPTAADALALGEAPTVELAEAPAVELAKAVVVVLAAVELSEAIAVVLAEAPGLDVPVDERLADDGARLADNGPEGVLVADAPRAARAAGHSRSPRAALTTAEPLATMTRAQKPAHRSTKG